MHKSIQSQQFKDPQGACKSLNIFYIWQKGSEFYKKKIIFNWTKN